MSAFAVRLIALVTMLTDHGAVFLRYKSGLGGQVYIILRSVGRASMPLYCFLLVNGFRKSGDSVRYLSRLCALAALSQIPFTLTFTKANYSLLAVDGLSLRFPPLVFIPLIVSAGLVWYFFVRRDFSLLAPLAALIAAVPLLAVGGVRIFGEKLNIFYTLALALAVLCVVKRIHENGLCDGGTLLLLAVLASALVLISPCMDYGAEAVIFVLMLYLGGERRVSSALIIAAWCLYRYPPTVNIFYFIFSLLSVVPVLLYNGRRGRNAKTFFYAIYPVHLLILGCAALIL